MTLDNNIELIKAKEELGDERFNNHLHEVFGITCLDFVKSIVINLPEPCYANCEYCIDHYLRHNSIDNKSFLEICEMVLKEFPNASKVSITGGSINSSDFNKLVNLIKTYLPSSSITWNTNGIGINEDYLVSIPLINHINLHRNSPYEDINKKVFNTNRNIISIEDAKKIFGENLCLRITVDESFDLNEYIKLEVPLYLNRLLPGNEKTDSVFNEVIEKLNISNDKDVRRRNVYLSARYKDIPVRICMGDSLSNHIPGRSPTYLNVAIVHRSGIVCGSWFEDDNVIFNPYKNEYINENNSTVLKKVKK